MNPPPLPNSKNRTARNNAWVQIAINLLAFPGMGTVMAGRRVGYVQAIIMVAAFLLITGYFVWIMSCAFRFFETGNNASWSQEYPQYAWTWKWGLGLFALSWIWSLISSVDILRRSQGTGEAKL